MESLSSTDLRIKLYKPEKHMMMLVGNHVGVICGVNATLVKPDGLVYTDGNDVCKEYSEMLMWQGFNLRKPMGDVLVKWQPRPKDVLSRPATMDVWIDRLGGASDQMIATIADKSKALQINGGRNASVQKQMLRAKATLKNQPHSGQVPRQSVIGYKWWGDASGPHMKSFLRKNVWEFLWVEDATNYCKINFGKHKSEANFFMVRLFAWSPYWTKELTTDLGTEYWNKHAEEICMNAGVLHLYTPEYQAQRRARIENKWYVSHSLARYMIARFDGARYLYEFAVAYACEISNCLVYKPTGKVPYEHFFGIKVDYSKFLVFGCTVCILQNARVLGVKSKHKDRAEWGFYLGWDSEQWMHITYGLDTQVLHYTPDFKAFETNFGAVHKFMKMNPRMEVDAVKEAQAELDALAQGENGKIDQVATNIRNSWMDVTQSAFKLWDDTKLKDVHVDKELPNVDIHKLPDGTTLEGILETIPNGSKNSGGATPNMQTTVPPHRCLHSFRTM